MLVLFTKPGCTLCDEARRSLSEAGADWDEVDIMQDEDAYRRYWADIPVLEKNGEPVLMHRFSAEEVQQI